VRWKAIVPALALVLSVGSVAARSAAQENPVTFEVQNFNEPQEYVGRFLTLRFQARNNTNRGLFMTVSATIPAGLTLVSPASISPPCPTFPNNCFLGFIQANTFANLSVTLRVDAVMNAVATGALHAESLCSPGIIIEAAATTAAAPCEPIFDRTASVRVVTFASPVELSIAVAPQPGWVGGDPITATYTIRNIHTSGLTNVVLTPGLPAGWVSTSGCAPPPQACTVGSIGRFGSVTRTYTLTPGGPATTPINARVTATFDACNDGCFTTANATAVAQVRIAPLPVLTVSPALGPPGFVTAATGTGFPNGAKVKLTWIDPSGRSLLTETLNLTVVNGGFSTQVLIFRRDQKGDRSLVAEWVSGPRFGPVTARFLVVPDVWTPPVPQRG